MAKKLVKKRNLRTELDSDKIRDRYKKKMAAFHRQSALSHKRSLTTEEVKQSTIPVPETESKGIMRLEMCDDFSILEFSEILKEFNDAYTSIRFFMRELSNDYAEPYNLLSFPSINPLPSVAQPIFSSVHFNSPGFWEVIGNLNVIKLFCDYLKQRHERQKDSEYRNRLEEEKLTFENMKLKNELISQHIKNLKDSGFSDEEIQELICNYISDPSEPIVERMDRGQITAVSIKSIDDIDS